MAKGAFLSLENEIYLYLLYLTSWMDASDKSNCRMNIRKSRRSTMLDLKFVRENPEIVKQNIRNKFQQAVQGDWKADGPGKEGGG